MQGMLGNMMGLGGMGGGQPSNEPMRDTAETVHVSSLALLKMLIHGRAGVPLEVMGLMIGEYVDDYTVRVTDVFSMPQTATGQSVEAVNPEHETVVRPSEPQWYWGPDVTEQTDPLHAVWRCFMHRLHSPPMLTNPVTMHAPPK